MKALYPFLAVVALAVIAYLGGGAAPGGALFAVVVPYAAAAIFLGGVSLRVFRWARTPVPFRIPTTCGQEKSLPWIRNNPLDCPHGTWGVLGRMALEVLLFRSLFRNTRVELREGKRLLYGSEKILWAAALAFHWSFLVVFIRHFRFFTEPVPRLIGALQSLDGFFQIGLPILYLSDLGLVGALTYLFVRRLLDGKLRYLSLPADYFALFLLLAVALSGIALRYLPAARADIVSVKQLALGLAGLRPVVPEGLSGMFIVHLFLVSVLFAYFPFSKLMHLAGVFLSPTRNLANNNRRVRHVNPWRQQVKVHTYEEWEEEFRERIRGAGLPLERE
jgi:nitrate reductase gamma subunit